MKKTIEKLIINKPFEEPKKYWLYIRESKKFVLKEGRRDSGYWQALPANKRTNAEDPGEFVRIPLVNQIRPRVNKWREKGYPNVTGVTKRLLNFWKSEDRKLPPFWCQLEAIETAIWLTEASPAEKEGIEIPSDGGDWQRQCLKLATGTGKTVVMAMIIVWQVLNKLANPKDKRFSSHILIVAPGITVRDRLKVLLPNNDDNFYRGFDLVDDITLQELFKAKIAITNWHILAPYNPDNGPKVVKKGEESDEAFVRRVLSKFGTAKNILVINDEAHHCHRPAANGNADEQATVWVSGIDRIHNARGVIKAYDLSATPFKPTGHNNQGEQLFNWIVSDFGLNDAIESGLVKTPKIAVRDDSILDKELRSKFFHIYEYVGDDLKRKMEPSERLPTLVKQAVNILSADWLQIKTQWEKNDKKMLPVMIMICNTTYTAARMEYSFEHDRFAVNDLAKNDGMLRIDQDALDKLESGKEVGAKKNAIINEREKFNTVGKAGKAGEQVRGVIGVNMLSEGWDAKTVTHILGLRAFASQLLCEQVVGRGLRRISYELNSEGFYEPEYVTIFGVPFTFLPIEDEEKNKLPQEEKPKTKIESLKERRALKIDWPHILRIDYKLNYFLDLDLDELGVLDLSSEDSPTDVDVAPIMDGRPNLDQIEKMNLNHLAKDYRLQEIKLNMAVELHEQFGDNWEGDPGSHIGQLIPIIEEFLESRKLRIHAPLVDTEKFRGILIALNHEEIVSHIGRFIRSSNREEPNIIFDPTRPKRSTATAMTWYTSKKSMPIVKSQISHAATDSAWEGSAGAKLEQGNIPDLVSWAKNDHLGFEIFYLWQGNVHAYYPDFIIKFSNERYLILEVKGQKVDQDEAKWDAAREWVSAVTKHGKFGVWRFRVLEDMGKFFDVVKPDFDGVETD